MYIISGESGRERLVVSQLIKDASRLLKDVEYAGTILNDILFSEIIKQCFHLCLAIYNLIIKHMHIIYIHNM